MSTRTRSLAARRLPLAHPDAQRAMLRRVPLAREFDARLADAGLWPLRPRRVEVFQVHVGKVCHPTCRHCHVDAAPDRDEVMSRETMQQCLDALAKTDIPVVDITGGAPEMNPHFRWLVGEVRALGRHVMDRCNLTILETPSHRDLPEFFAEHHVEVVCSLPHYLESRTDRQRGDGVYERSIRALQRLNALGYGDGRSGLRLVLVANPVGAFTIADQRVMEDEFRKALGARHGVVFDQLFCLTNMPISRYLEWLVDSGNLDRYMTALVTAFNPSAVAGLMCRNTVSVGWDGVLYDCDFNQMLDMPVAESAPRHIRDFDLAALTAREIATDRHCFGCTAGEGSSCGGATT
ncbi:MAG: arsenosugar biosynthesis radical SAM (seleno)protein ArsS [Polyangiales bacterium]